MPMKQALFSVYILNPIGASSNSLHFTPGNVNLILRGLCKANPRNGTYETAEMRSLTGRGHTKRKSQGHMPLGKAGTQGSTICSVPTDCDKSCFQNTFDGRGLKQAF